MSSYPVNVTFYNFTATKPVNGHCEFQHFGYKAFIAEPGASVFAIMTALMGIFGLWKCNNVPAGTRYMFSLLLGYGISSAGNTIFLWNGFHKSAGVLLNLMQSIIIIRLITTMKFPPFNKEAHFHLISGILMSTFGIYPIIAHVIGSSFDNPWVSWLTFDLIWAALLLIFILIFVYRRSYPQYDVDHGMFLLSFNAIVTCIAAYVFWLIDTFACSYVTAVLRLYGLWLILMGLTFYYLTILDAFLQSSWQGYKPVITRWPKRFIILYVHIHYEKEE